MPFNDVRDSELDIAMRDPILLSTVPEIRRIREALGNAYAAAARVRHEFLASLDPTEKTPMVLASLNARAREEDQNIHCQHREWMRQQLMTPRVRIEVEHARVRIEAQNEALTAGLASAALQRAESSSFPMRAAHADPCVSAMPASGRVREQGLASRQGASAQAPSPAAPAAVTVHQQHSVAADTQVASQGSVLSAAQAKSAIDDLFPVVNHLTREWTRDAADIRGFERSEHIVTMSADLQVLVQQGAPRKQILEASFSLKDAKTRELIEREKFDTLVSYGQAAVDAVSGIAGFTGDRKLARQIKVGGSALISLGTNIAGLAGYGPLAEAHPAIAAVAIVSSLADLAGLFGDDDESNPMGEMLQELLEMVSQLREEMHERFDLLDEKLDKIHDDLSQKINEIGLQNRETQQLIRVEAEHSRRTQKQIKEQIQSVAQQVDLLFASVRSEQVNRALHEIIDPVYCSLNRLSIQPDPAQYEAWLSQFKMHLEHSAYSAVLTGDRTQATDQDASTWNLSGKQATEAFFHINALIGHLGSINPQWRDMPRQANMLLWAYPSLAVLRLIYLLNHTDTGTIRRNEFDILSLMVNKAKEQEQCLMALKSPEIAAALIAEYKTALLDVASELNALFGDFVTRSNRRLNDELELVRQRAWAGDSEQLNLQELGLKLDYPGWFASFKYLHHSGYHKHHGRHDLTGTCESNYRSAQNNVINEAKKRPPAPRAQALKGILIPRPHADIAIDVSDYDLHRPCVFPVAAGDPILPLYSSDGRYADLRGALIPESLVEAEFLGLGRFEYRYEADLVGKKIMISSCFKANEALITLRRLSLDFEPGPFDRKEALFWGWLGRTSVSFQERSYSYEGTKGNRGGSYYLATSMPIISVSSNSPLMNLVNSAAGPARMDIIEALPANTALMTQKIKEAKSALLLSQLKETYDSATSGPGSTLHAALEKLEAAYQRLQGFSMLALSDAYCAQDVRLAEFFKPDSTVFFSRADILKRLNPHAINLIQSAPLLAATSAARASATALCSAGSVDISQLLTKSTEALSCSLEQPLIAALNEHAGKTGHGFFDGIVAHLSEAQAFYKDRVKEESYRDVFEAHSQTQKQFEQVSALLGIIEKVFSEKLSAGVQRQLLEEIESKAREAHIAIASVPVPGSLRSARLSLFPPAASPAARAAAASVASAASVEYCDDEKEASGPSHP